MDIQSRTSSICFHYRIRLVYLIRARVPFLTHVGAFLWLDHHRPPIDRANLGLTFGLNVRHFICLSTYLTISVTRLLPVVMKFVINVIVTKAEWRKGKDVLFPPVSKWRPIYRYFSHLRSNALTDPHEIWIPLISL